MYRGMLDDLWSLDHSLKEMNLYGTTKEVDTPKTIDNYITKQGVDIATMSLMLGYFFYVCFVKDGTWKNLTLSDLNDEVWLIFAPAIVYPVAHLVVSRRKSKKESKYLIDGLYLQADGQTLRVVR